MSKNQCPYCDHDNPAESKFCNACGAVLHLAPCPKCGAVNDKGAAQCYRCHHVLSFGGVAALSAPPAAPEPAQIVAPATVVVDAAARYAKKDPKAAIDVVATEPASSHRPPAIAIAIVLIAFAVASYYAWRQRATITKPEPVVATPADNAGGGAINKVPGAVTTAAPPRVQSAAERSNPSAEKAAAAIESARAAVPPTAPALAASTTPTPPASAEDAPRLARRRPSPPVAEKQVPSPGPCTEAIAALGLCTLESTQGRQ